MITIIFLDDNKTPVSITFKHDHSLNVLFLYGFWDKETNVVTLNDDGWELLQKNRNNIRNLKPMMDRLDDTKKICSGNFYLKDGGIKSYFFAPVEWFK